jgi:beta propeller repeat protein
MKHLLCLIGLLIPIRAQAFVAPAPLQEIPIAVAAGSDQRLPTVSENWIAWQDDRSSPIVYQVRARNRASTAEFWVTPHPGVGLGYHGSPRLSGDTLLWQGNPAAKGTLFYDDLAPRIRNPQQVFPQPIHQYAGDIAGNLVVWQEAASDPLSQGDIYGSYLGSQTKFAITTSNKAYIKPVTDGRFVVWREWISANHLGIFAQDLLTGQSMQLANTGPDPAIDQGVVAYAVSSGIAVRNLLTGQSSVITGAPPFSLAISGNLIAYSTRAPGKSDYDLFGVNLLTGHKFLISDAPGNQIWPDVHGDFVVWSDDRSGDYDVYGAFVPEPAALTLAGLGAILLPVARRRLARRTGVSPRAAAF